MDVISLRSRIVASYVGAIGFFLFCLLILGLDAFMAWLFFLGSFAIPLYPPLNFLLIGFVALLLLGACALLFLGGRSIHNAAIWRRLHQKRQDATTAVRLDLLALEQHRGSAEQIVLPLTITIQRKRVLIHSISILYAALSLMMGVFIVQAFIAEGWQSLLQNSGLLAPLLAYYSLFVALRYRPKWVCTDEEIAYGLSEKSITRIKWENIRFVALYGKKYQPPVAFEIASSNGIIPFIWHREGVSTIWIRGYVAATDPVIHNQQMDDLLAYILARTKLPLYDLRED